MEFKMTAKTFKGLEEVLAEELTGLGANNIQIQRRAVDFTGDKALLYKANLHLRTASRILLPLDTFKVKDTDDLYDKVKKMDWEKYMNVKTGFSIDSTVFSDTFRHSKFVTYRVKDAIVDFFYDKYRERPSVRLTNPQLYINVHIAQNICTISLDSSGESLHKRGYRAAQGEAPISEALAAGMILMSGWRGETVFYDPMCGSGTLLIEAALIAMNIPPGIFRSSFAFEKWSDYDDELFQQLYNDDSAEKELKHGIIGSDISIRAVKEAEQNIQSAGLSKYITVHQVALQDAVPPVDKAIMITNPPYGERINPRDINQLYADLGTFLKHKFNGNRAWVISSDEMALKRIGMKPGKRIPLLNGALDCLYCEYEIFDGKRSDHLERKYGSRKPGQAG